MYFKHPDILFTLFALIIPVIIHLFQLQRFENVPFTNVKMLKQIEQESRKSSTLKKWLILLSRLLLLASLIFAFAQPYLAKESEKEPAETIIYLDNSLSMQAKGKKGPLLQTAVQDLIENYNNTKEKITLITNDKIYKNIRPGHDLLDIKPTPLQKSQEQILLQISTLSSDKEHIRKNIILISDFQGSTLKDLQTDTLNNYYLTQLKPVKAGNIYIDSILITEKNNESIMLRSRIRNYNTPDKKVNISLFVNDQLEGKTSITIKRNGSLDADFTISNKDIIRGKITIDAADPIFDNTRYFSIGKSKRKNILSIGINDDYLKKIYSGSDFNYLHKKLRSLDFSEIDKQDLIIFNRIEKISNPLGKRLKEFTGRGGNLVIIPSENTDISDYNQLFATLNLGKIKEKNSKKRLITKISYSDPFFKNVFQKKIRNFQYPFVNLSYDANIYQGRNLLTFDDQKGFIIKNKSSSGNIYWIASPLKSEFTNFMNSPLIIPVFYNFTISNITNTGLYYEIGKKNRFEVAFKPDHSEVLHLVNKDSDFIPRQEQRSDKVIIETRYKPLKPGIYQVKDRDKILRYTAYNYSNDESILQYATLKHSADQKDNVHYFNDLNYTLESINETYKTENLWQLFLIFALIFLIVEILLQKLL